MFRLRNKKIVKKNTFVGVEPMYAECGPRTAMSDVLNRNTTEASPKKDAQVVYIITPDTAIHSL